MKYREMVARKTQTVKMTSSIDHLWQVKEIEYSNIMNVMESCKK